MTGSLRYLVVALSLWVFVPELRRIVDWRIGFEPIPILSVLPLAALAPFVVMAIRNWQRVPAAMRVVAWLWIGGFAYALALSFALGNAASGLYAFALFTLPMAVGVWASTLDAPLAALRTFVGAAFVLATISSAYGLLQYVAPPAWDVAWMNVVGPILGGYPIPFQVRVFGTLNSAGPFANWVAVVLVMAVGLFRARNLLFGVQVAICTAATALSLVRSAWLACALGLVAYLVLAPRRVQALSAIVLACAACAAAAVVLPSALGNANIATSLQQRIGTLGSVGSDESANNRQEQIAEATRAVALEPLGQGLGVVGTSTKLSTAAQQSTVLDSGYLSRLTELGLPGFVLYLLAILISLGVALAGARSAALESRNLFAVAAAVQIALIGLDVSGDVHLGLIATCCWMMSGLAIAQSARDRLAGADAHLDRWVALVQAATGAAR